MFSFTQHHLLNESFLLTSDRSIFWEEEKILIVSDLHLGKAGHFRKSGIGVPQTIFREDMQRLIMQLQYFKPREMLVVGDLFHSTENKEHNLFLKWRKDFPHLQVRLVKGNHDILDPGWYTQAGIEVSPEMYTIKNFTFTHDISCCTEVRGKYYFSGHIHPGVTIHGSGRQSLKFPCFYFGQKFAVLPAFGKFTGTYPIGQKKGDNIFAIVEDRIMKIQ